MRQSTRQPNGHQLSHSVALVVFLPRQRPLATRSATGSFRLRRVRVASTPLSSSKKTTPYDHMSRPGVEGERDGVASIRTAGASRLWVQPPSAQSRARCLPACHAACRVGLAGGAPSQHSPEHLRVDVRQGAEPNVEQIRISDKPEATSFDVVQPPVASKLGWGHQPSVALVFWARLRKHDGSPTC